MRRLRRAALPAATVLTTALLGGTAAFAQVADRDVRVTSPADGSTLKERVTLDVAVDIDGADRVDVRLTQDGQSQASGTAMVSLPCVSGCDEPGPTTWGERTYDPQKGAPFSPEPQCNGQWTIQPRVNGGAWLTGSTITLSVPPKAPSNVRITVTDDVATISWTPDKSPDVAWHRVERSTGGGPFTVLAELAGSASSFQDDGITHGEHVYRVVAARPDGLVNGNPAVPCTDRGDELVASSKNTRLTHTPDGSTTEGPAESGSGSGTSGSGTSGSGSSGSGTSGSGTSGSGSGGSSGGSGTQQPTSPEEEAAQRDPEAQPSASPTPRPARSARPIAPPPSAQRQTGLTAQAPELGNRPEDDGPYYGEGDEFSEEIDYGDAPLVAGEPVIVGYDENGEPIFETVQVPGEVVAFGVVSIDNGKIRMLAMGLLLVALALHGRRWLNAN